VLRFPIKLRIFSPTCSCTTWAKAWPTALRKAAPAPTSSELLLCGASDSASSSSMMGVRPTLVDAIRAHRSHGSEANKVIEHFNKLTVQEQQEIIDFLRSL
jgi:hypothetical protein